MSSINLTAGASQNTLQIDYGSGALWEPNGWINKRPINDVLYIVDEIAYEQQSQFFTPGLRSFRKGDQWTVKGSSDPSAQNLKHKVREAWLFSEFRKNSTTESLASTLTETVMKISNEYYDGMAKAAILTDASETNPDIEYCTRTAQPRNITLEFLENQVQLTITGWQKVTPKGEPNAAPIHYKYQRNIQFDFTKFVWIPQCKATELANDIFKGTEVTEFTERNF